MVSFQGHDCDELDPHVMILGTQNPNLNATTPRILDSFHFPPPYIYIIKEIQGRKGQNEEFFFMFLTSRVDS